MIVFAPSAAHFTPVPGTFLATSWEEFEASAREPVGFYLTGCSSSQAHEIALAIRRSPYWYCLVYVDSPGVLSPLVDGVLDLAAASHAAARAASLHRSLRLDTAELHFDERLLYFLYLRDPGELVPQPDRQSKSLYAFPVAAALADPKDVVEDWLEALARRRLLEPAALHDRTRHCRQCASAHLHYLDVCPHCTSMHIRKGTSLHCFTCGHVAPDGDFRTEEGLACPKCAARLRHIGVDYDRPLTQYVCAGCHHAFVEAGVVARCLDCGVSADPGSLDVREVSTLRITAHGRAAVRAGQIQESFAALDNLNYVVPNYFRHMLNWAIATQHRHKEFNFALMLIEFRNAPELIDKHGASRVFLLLDEFARRLHELLRTSDITTRTAEECMWLFLPFSSAEGLTRRVQQALSDLQTRDGPVLHLRIRSLSAPHDIAAGEEASVVMSRLQSDA
jgi:GGDEF domain-containing protein